MTIAKSQINIKFQNLNFHPKDELLFEIYLFFDVCIQSCPN